MTKLQWIPVLGRQSQRDFHIQIARGDLIAGRRGYTWTVTDRDGRIRRMGWTAGTRDDAQIEAARDVLDLCSRLTVVNEPSWDDEITQVKERIA